MPPQPPMGPPPGTAPEPKKRRRWPWVVGVVVAFIVGTTLGGAASADPEPEVVTETETITETETEEVEVPPADLEEQQQAADERDSELDTREEELDTRASDLDSRSSDLDTREEGLDTREEEISTQETEVEENTIPGTGVYIVGEDIDAGTYSTEVTGINCYWARLSGTGGDLDDIITNNNVSEGQALVTIADTDVAFETNGCGEWTLRQ